MGEIHKLSLGLVKFKVPASHSKGSVKAPFE